MEHSTITLISESNYGVNAATGSIVSSGISLIDEEFNTAFEKALGNIVYGVDRFFDFEVK